MSVLRVSMRILPAVLVVLGGTAEVARADLARNRFYKGYYLEQADGDWAAAAKLYEKVVEDSSADRELRSLADARLAGCREELASSDFASLMPPDAWAYVEIKSPGDQLVKLLDKLGLLATPDQAVAEGERRVAISPVLIKEVLGIRGAAVAITGFDMVNQIPHGVLVFHPGDLEVIRGLLETGLPVGGEVVEPIGGFPTYNIEGQAFVTLTSKLVIASAHRSQIEGVIDRLKGTETRSMATNPALTEVIKDREDALLLFFVNAKAMMPVIKPLIAAGSLANREMAMAQRLLDIDSFNSLAGRLGVSDDGLFLDLGLRLDEGHQNLVFNFLRTPAINPETLKCIPAGAAAVLIGALNDAGSRYSSNPGGSTDGPPVVTALDIGREIFANITSIAVFAMPPGDSPRVQGGPPIPDVGAVMTVNDPAKSEALWTQMLGLAAFASGAPAIQGPSDTIDGTLVRSYQFPEGVTIYFATSGNDVLVGTSKAAIASSIRAKKSGRSINKDSAFEASLGRLTENTTQALFIHAGRCTAIARQFMSEQDLAEAAPAFEMLSDTCASFIEEHSDELYRTTALVTGIPDVGDFVAKMITAEVRKDQGRKRLARAKKSGKWDEALEAINSQLREQPGNLDLVKAKFDILATGKKDRDAAMAFADSVYDKVKDNADVLNTLAWSLLTEKKFGDTYSELALKLSKQSNELTDHGNWMFVDTLALAKFKTGEAEDAVKLQKKAIELCGDCWGLKEMKQNVARFEETLEE